jgi:hypothetical protein
LEKKRAALLVNNAKEISSDRPRSATKTLNIQRKTYRIASSIPLPLFLLLLRYDPSFLPRILKKKWPPPTDEKSALNGGKTKNKKAFSAVAKRRINREEEQQEKYSQF